MAARTLHDVIMVLVWLAFLYLLYAGLHARFGHPGWPLLSGGPAPIDARSSLGDAVSGMLLTLCALPAVLIWCAVLMTTQQLDRVRSFEILTPRPWPKADRRSRTEWDATVEGVQLLWHYEQQRLGRAIEQLREQSFLFGVVCTVSLCSATLIVLPAVHATGGPITFHAGALEQAALAVATAAVVFFVLTLGRVVVRVANRDVSPRQLSWATRDLLAVEVSAAVLSASASEISPAGRPLTGVLLGATAGLLGAVVLRIVTDRAAARFNVQPIVRAPDLDLARLEGLSDDVHARLREEGIDSIQALAFTPIPRLFFSTRYSLPILVDLQSQALLMVHFGAVMRVRLRDVLGIRGVLAAQQLALAIYRARVGDDPSRAADDPSSPARRPIGRQGWESLVSRLGYPDLEQAEMALQAVLDKEEVRRLHVFWRSTAAQGDLALRDPGSHGDDAAAISERSPAAGS